MKPRRRTKEKKDKIGKAKKIKVKNLRKLLKIKQKNEHEETYRLREARNLLTCADSSLDSQITKHKKNVYKNVHKMSNMSNVTSPQPQQQ